MCAGTINSKTVKLMDGVFNLLSLTHTLKNRHSKCHQVIVVEKV